MKIRCTQVCIAVSVCVLVAIITKVLQSGASLHTRRQVLSVTLCEKIPLQQALADPADLAHERGLDQQLNLFDS